MSLTDFTIDCVHCGVGVPIPEPLLAEDDELKCPGCGLVNVVTLDESDPPRASFQDCTDDNCEECKPVDYYPSEAVRILNGMVWWIETHEGDERPPEALMEAARKVIGEQCRGCSNGILSAALGGLCGDCERQEWRSFDSPQLPEKRTESEVHDPCGPFGCDNDDCQKCHHVGGLPHAPREQK